MFISGNKKIFAVAIVLVAIGVGLFVFVKLGERSVKPAPQPTDLISAEPQRQIIGKSVQGREIESFTFGATGGGTAVVDAGVAPTTEVKHLAFVGGIHGGYEWNSVLLAYEFMDYLKKNPQIVPENVKVTIIPSANPDGVYKIIGKEGRFSLADVLSGTDQSPGRFNANGVDLNRNFDCKWKPEGVWRSKSVGTGSTSFSEPEARAIQNFVLENKPSAVVFWHSQANNVYASECNDGVLPETLDIMNAYSFASGYGAVKAFDQYEVNGDAEGWLASIGIPAITVELKTHESIEWDKNLAGVKAVLGYYGAKI